MQPAELAIALRRRSPWEAMDLGLAMLQRWWRLVYGPHLAVGAGVAALAFCAAYVAQSPWVALVVLWWLKPLNDRVVLHVLARAVFGEHPGVGATLAAAPQWLRTGLVSYLLLRLWPDLARSFNLPVRQLEGQRGSAGRSRRALLGRRMHGHAAWLTLACLHFEAVLFWSFALLSELLLPASSADTRSFAEAFVSSDAWTWGDAAAYAAAVLLLEPFYVASGFALYLNRRTILEGWDIEVALRRIAVRHAGLIALFCFSCVALLCLPGTALAQKDAKREITEVLKAPEFGHEREVLQWRPRNTVEEKADEAPEWLRPLGHALAAATRVALWIGAAIALVFLAWWTVRRMPRAAPPGNATYRPPAELFGMALAPDTLPTDVSAEAAELARAGRVREALGLLYRGALSELVHRRAVALAAGHTEADVLALAPGEAKGFLERLIGAWRQCAYARRQPSGAEVERLALEYRGFAA